MSRVGEGDEVAAHRRQLMARVRSVSGRADRAEEAAQELRHDLTRERGTTD